MFFRLFATTGVVWTVEIINYILYSKKTNNDDKVAGLLKKIYPNDKGNTTVLHLIGCSPGVLLFFVTVWKEDVIELIYKRLVPTYLVMVTNTHNQIIFIFLKMKNGVMNRNSRVISSTPDYKVTPGTRSMDT